MFKPTRQLNLADLFISILKTSAIISISAVFTILAAKLVGGAELSINQVSTQKQSTFDVTGETKITTIPDEAQISLGITVNQPTVAQAQEQINQVISQITNQLKSLGIEKKDIKTNNYSLNPEYDYSLENRGTPRITGYRANTSLQVKVTDFDKLNQAIDLATTAGANQVNGISFGLSEKKQDELEKQARTEAVKDAKEKAKSLAGIAGMKLGKIVNIYEYQNTPMPMMERSMALQANDMGGGIAEPTQVEPGSTSFDYSVTISYETL